MCARVQADIEHLLASAGGLRREDWPAEDPYRGEGDSDDDGGGEEAGGGGSGRHQGDAAAAAGVASRLSSLTNGSLTLTLILIPTSSPTNGGPLAAESQRAV